MAEVIDLNALVPKDRIVKINDKELTIKPPTTEQMFALASLGEKLKDADDADEQTLRNLFKAMEETLYPMVDGLSEVTLLPVQTFKLYEILSNMANPTATGEQTESPKVEQDSSQESQPS